jgi:folate-binding protein YgfZ
MIDTQRIDKALNFARSARKTALLAVLGKDGPKSGIADLGALLVSGADATSFLHSQLTNEVKALKAGEGNLSARVTRTGTLVRYFSLHAIPQALTIRNSSAAQSFVLLFEREGIPSLTPDLGKFAVVEDVELAEISNDYEWIALQGPQAPTIAEAALGKIGDESWADLAENAIRELPAGAFAVARSLTGDAGFIIAVPKESGDFSEVLARLQDVAKAKDAIFLSSDELNDTLEILRIEAGLVRIGPDAEEGKLVLPETGMEQSLVSYTKGCYLGQEVIARIRTYGSVPNVLRGLVFNRNTGVPPVSSATADAQGQRQTHGQDAGATTEQLALLEKLPAVGADVLLEDGKKVGTITSRTISPVLEAPVAYAYLDRASRTPGTTLKIKASDGGVLSARVALLPFYRAADLKSRVAFLHDRAIRLFADQQDDKAVELLVEALRLDSSFSDGYEALGVILGRNGKFTEAIDIFKRLEEVAPNEPMVNTNLSLYYMKLGDKQTAEDEKAKATVKQFSRFGAMKKDEQRAKEEEAAKKADALRKKAMFEEVIEIDPEDPIALFGLGNALSALGEWDAAEKALAKATSVQKDNSAVYVAHGKALEALGREPEALEIYRAGMAVASKKGDLMPLKEMERRVLLLEPMVKKKGS